MSASSLSLTGAVAVSLDPAEPVVPDATIVIEDGVIQSVSERGPATGRTLDCRGMVAIPGLVNAHAHTLESFLRGCGGQLALLPWIKRTHVVMDALDARGAYLATRLATTEMLLSGTTAYLDPEVPTDFRFPAMAQAAADSGLRAGLTLLLEDRGGYHQWSSRTEPQLTPDELRLVADWHDAADGRIKTWLGPSVLSAITPELGRTIRAQSNARHLGIAFHCAEDPEDRRDTEERAGVGPVDFADRCGLLCDRTVVTHGVLLEPAEVAHLRDRGASLVHCPSSNAKLGSGVAPIPAMLDAGLNVALGTDGGSSNDTYDMFLEIRLAGLIHRAVARNPSAMSANTALELATRNGARAMGLDAGCLKPGLVGDVVLLDLASLGFAPIGDVVDSIVFAGASGAVRRVIVGGQVLVDDGLVIGVDMAALVAEASEAARAALESAGVMEELEVPVPRQAFGPNR